MTAARVQRPIVAETALPTRIIARGPGAGARVLLLDNYDSFTHNVLQALAVAGAEVIVARNDRTSVDEILEREATHLVISPGPGRPEAAGISVALIAACAGRLPILGVCLGHQAIAVAFGGRVGPAARLMHGKTSRIRHAGTGLFAGAPMPMPVGRYHSLAVEAAGLPDCLRATAFDEEGEIMALEHVDLPIVGVQFHPESVLTPDGPALLGRFLQMRAGAASER